MKNRIHLYAKSIYLQLIFWQFETPFYPALIKEEVLNTIIFSRNRITSFKKLKNNKRNTMLMSILKGFIFSTNCRHLVHVGVMFQTFGLALFHCVITVLRDNLPSFNFSLFDRIWNTTVLRMSQYHYKTKKQPQRCQGTGFWACPIKIN